jgi:hypothetical protein
MITTLKIVATDLIHRFYELNDTELNEIQSALNEEPLEGNLNGALALKFKKPFYEEKNGKYIDIQCDSYKVIKLEIGTLLDNHKIPKVLHECKRDRFSDNILYFG